MSEAKHVIHWNYPLHADPSKEDKMSEVKQYYLNDIYKFLAAFEKSVKSGEWSPDDESPLGPSKIGTLRRVHEAVTTYATVLIKETNPDLLR